MALVHQRPIPQPGCQLKQLSSVGRENHDPIHVARYDSIEDAGARNEVEILQEIGLNAQHVVVGIGLALDSSLYRRIPRIGPGL